MKRIFFLLLLIKLAPQCWAQSSDVLSGLKDKANLLVQEKAKKITDSAKANLLRLSNNLIDKVNVKSDKIVENVNNLGNNISNLNFNNLNKNTVTPITNGNTIRKDSSVLIKPDEVNDFLLKNYPQFYQVYNSAIKSDTILKHVFFNYTPIKPSIGKFNPTDNSITFDLSFFDITPKNVISTHQNQLIVIFYNQLGALYYFDKEKTNSISFVREEFIYNYILNKCFLLAQNGNYLPLEFFTSVILSRCLINEKLIINNDALLYQTLAYKSIVHNELFKQALLLIYNRL